MGSVGNSSGVSEYGGTGSCEPIVGKEAPKLPEVSDVLVDDNGGCTSDTPAEKLSRILQMFAKESLGGSY